MSLLNPFYLFILHSAWRYLVYIYLIFIKNVVSKVIYTGRKNL